MGYHEERIVFRFVNLSLVTADHLCALRPSAAARPQRRGPPGRYVVSFVVNPHEDYDWIPDAVRDNHLDESQYGLFVSLVSESESDTIVVPEFARALVRKVGGVVDFSFTFIAPDD